MAVFNVSPRAEKGEKPHHLRKAGFVPMAIVDREHKTHNVKASLASLKSAVGGADAHGVIEIQIEGEGQVRKAILKSIDSDAIARQVLNATFQEVAEGDTIKTDVPVVAQGHLEESAEENDVLTTVTDHLKVKAKVSDLPESITVDVSKLEPGGHISAGDVALPAGVELVSPPDTILFVSSRVAGEVAEETDLTTEPDGLVDDAAKDPA